MLGWDWNLRVIDSGSSAHRRAVLAPVRSGLRHHQLQYTDSSMQGRSVGDRILWKQTFSGPSLLQLPYYAGSPSFGPRTQPSAGQWNITAWGCLVTYLHWTAVCLLLLGSYLE